MTIIELHGRGLVGGVVEGEALVTQEGISGWGGIEPLAGRIIESRHELNGESFKDKVLVFAGAKGSSGWSGMFHMSRLAGSAPKAMIFTYMNTKIALGVVVTRVPAMTDLDQDPLTVIETGDWVHVDADHGLVVVTKAHQAHSKRATGAADADAPPIVEGGADQSLAPDTRCLEKERSNVER